MLIPIRNTKDFVCVSQSLKFIAQNVEGKIKINNYNFKVKICPDKD